MPSNHTTNYQLSQWVKSDQVRMEDFNADNAKIDAAIKAEVNARTVAVEALNAQVARLGNCRIELLRYTGTGQCGADHPTVINFSAPPVFFVIFGGRSVAFGSRSRDHLTGITYSSGQSYSFGGSWLSVTWSGNRMTLVTEYDENQMNQRNEIYLVAAFYAQG